MTYIQKLKYKLCKGDKMFKLLKDHNLHPSRNLGYTAYFSTEVGDIMCECCASDNLEDDRLYLEVPCEETFGKICDTCDETIEPDVGYPTDFIEFIETLQFQGWCLSSSKSFARNHIEDEYIFEQASFHLKELMDIGDQEFGNCEEDISYKYDLDTDDMTKVKKLYDIEDAKLCLQV